jgi:hypothetical protein
MRRGPEWQGPLPSVDETQQSLINQASECPRFRATDRERVLLTS